MPFKKSSFGDVYLGKQRQVQQLSSTKDLQQRTQGTISVPSHFSLEKHVDEASKKVETPLRTDVKERAPQVVTRGKTHGFRNFLIVSTFLYFGMGSALYFFLNRASDGAYKKYFNIYNWPLLALDEERQDRYYSELGRIGRIKRGGDIVSLKDRRIAGRGGSTRNSEESSSKTYLDESSEDLDEQINKTEDMIADMASPFLGKDRAKRIMDIAKDTSLTSQQTAERVVDEVPTGLPDNWDKFVKGVAKKYAKESTK